MTKKITENVRAPTVFIQEPWVLNRYYCLFDKKTEGGSSIRLAFLYESTKTKTFAPILT